MRLPEYTSEIMLTAALVVGLLAFDAWHGRAASRSRAEPPSVASMLESCSPFSDRQERRLLLFDTRSGTVELSETLGSKHDSATRIAYKVSESSGAVRLVLGTRQPSNYTLVVIGDQCILGTGPLSATDLEQSWYGLIDHSDSGADQCSLPGFC